MKFIAILIFLCSCFPLFAQTSSAPFAAIDKRVKTIQASTAGELANKLTTPYKTETEKVRAIFKWITENIAYDTKGYHNVEEIYKGLWRPEISDIDSVIKKDYNDRIVQKVLTEKRAVCDGYSRLFKTLCDHAGIQSVIITGFIRWSSDPVGVATNRAHAWNAVFINNSWKLIDATWASGYCNAAVTTFTKFYDEFFFFTNPVHFFNDHFPDDKKWSLLPNTPTLYQFYNFPFYYPAFYKCRILSLSPVTGHIEVTVRNKKVVITMETNEVTKDMYVYETPYVESKTNVVDTLTDKELDELYKPKYKTDGTKVTYTYEIQSENAEKLHVMYNNKLILTYGLKIRK